MGGAYESLMSVPINQLGKNCGKGNEQFAKMGLSLSKNGKLGASSLSSTDSLIVSSMYPHILKKTEA